MLIGSTLGATVGVTTGACVSLDFEAKTSCKDELDATADWACGIGIVGDEDCKG